MNEIVNFILYLSSFLLVFFSSLAERDREKAKERDRELESLCVLYEKVKVPPFEWSMKTLLNIRNLTIPFPFYADSDALHFTS